MLFRSNRDPEEALKDWYNRYPDRLWGPNFRLWAEGKRHKKKSTSNGAIVRLAALPLVMGSVIELTDLALNITRLTHNSVEAKKSVVMAMYYAHALRGADTKQADFLWDLHVPKMDKTFEQLWLETKWSATCYDTLPHAIISFKAGTNFEDCIRNAICFGSDSDTMAAITGMFAEAYYGLDEFDAKYDIEDILQTYLSEDMLKVIYQYKLIKLYGRA